MPRLTWDDTGKRFYETGVDRVVLFVQGNDGAYGAGVAWNGVTAINESPSGAEPEPLYADNIKYLNLMSTEELGYSIEAYTYPEEFEVCDGSASLGEGVTIGQQERKQFGIAYRSKLGNDTQSTDYGYKLHLYYGGLASPSEKNYSTINDSPEAATFSWEVSTTPVNVDGFKPTASLTIDSTKIASEKLKKIEDLLYGTDSVASKLPTPDEIKKILDGSAAA